MKQTAYKYLSLFLIVNLAVLLLFLALGRMQAALACIVLAGINLLLRSCLIKCGNCGCRPGLWIMGIWTILLSPGDALLLRNCPKCEKSLADS